MSPISKRDPVLVRPYFLFCTICLFIVIPLMTFRWHTYQTRKIPPYNIIMNKNLRGHKTKRHIEPDTDTNRKASSNFSFTGVKYERKIANSSCILVGCSSKGTPGKKYFWDFYTKSGYSTTFVTFDRLNLNNQKAHPAWCRIPSIVNEIEHNPKSKIIYMDVDTMANLKTWCDLPYLGKLAPIIMNSLHRARSSKTDHFTVHGSQIQSNAFIVAPGQIGINALNRWTDSYGPYGVLDQGSIHLHEKGLCGVPGWIHCYSNPFQQNCHCAGGFDHVKARKEACIQRLFNGSRAGCSYSQIMDV